jgi:hypothetical protein
MMACRQHKRVMEHNTGIKYDSTSTSCRTSSDHISILAFFKLWRACVHDKWVPITTAWHILKLQMEGWPPDMEGGCKYIE